MNMSLSIVPPVDIFQTYVELLWFGFQMVQVDLQTQMGTTFPERDHTYKILEARKAFEMCMWDSSSRPELALYRAISGVSTE